MPRWVGFIGSWAMFVLALGLAAFAVAGETINIRDQKRLSRLSLVDQMIEERLGVKAGELRKTTESRAAEVNTLQNRVQQVAQQTDDLPDTGQTIVISTAENRLYVRRGGQQVFQAVCSTGKGTRMAIDGKTLVFETPIGKLKVISKEENPMWVPPDWHYVEQARKSGMRVVRLQPGQSIDKATGQPVGHRDEGVWSWFGSGSGGTVLKVKGKNVVEVSDGYERELPPGQMIVAGGAVIIPPVGTEQRRFDKVLGRYRLNLGDGYAIHGTQETSKLGQSVSHGCVRLGDSDIEQLYAMSSVGDTVIIY